MTSEKEQEFHQRVVLRLGQRIGQLEIDLAVAKAVEAELREIISSMGEPAAEEFP